ncbi:hypothetical protein D9619_007181 [Psilocybe cf. subviscida]|uniref:Uncharacterized protein n=1 Tax=Psilocybe cf. subviscida TaxID=2480587 RepID=A0A8H5B246_9AGAR|nr:hypothetical protein D9619_007181 [Psilocybe cf. subviscida]
MTRPHTFTTPHGVVFKVILESDPVFSEEQSFETWPESTQIKYIELMKGHLRDLYADGSLRHLSVLAGNEPNAELPAVTPEIAAFYREDRIDGTGWKLAQALRKTTPTRIAEAVPLLRYIIDRQKKLNNGALKEALPSFYLGVAFSYTPGEEQRAIDAFTEGFEVFNKIYQKDINLNELWARSHFARVLRQKGRIEEAKRQELQTRRWILGNLTFCAPSTFKRYIEGPWGTGEHIKDHGDVLEEFSQIEEITPAQAIWHKGGQTIIANYGRKS